MHDDVRSDAFTLTAFGRTSLVSNCRTCSRIVKTTGMVSWLIFRVRSEAFVPLAIPESDHTIYIVDNEDRLLSFSCWHHIAT